MENHSDFKELRKPETYWLPRWTGCESIRKMAEKAIFGNNKTTTYSAFIVDLYNFHQYFHSLWSMGARALLTVANELGSAFIGALETGG